MACPCKICYEWSPSSFDSMGATDEKAYCKYLKEDTNRDYTCSHGSIIAMNKPIKKNVAATGIKKKATLPVIVHFDKSRPVLEPFEHQQEAIDRYTDEDEIALFFEMGCGKSFTTLAIAQNKYIKNTIKGILVIAPNDVHKQWFDEVVYGVNKDGDGILWQELSIDFEAQCIGGRSGQFELYPFSTDLFKFISINVDTFSTPNKWKQIVKWANSDNYMIVIDEATCIKNPSSQRSKHLLYGFNDVIKNSRCTAILSSKKKYPVRCVLTGTPVTNGPIDLWSIMEFVRPNYFGMNYYRFRAYFGMTTQLVVATVKGDRTISINLTKNTWQIIKNCNDYHEASFLTGCTEDTYMTIKHQNEYIGAYKHIDELKQLLIKTATFKKLTECVDMPPTNYIKRTVSMSPEQQAAYKSMRNSLLAQYNEYTTTAKNRLVVDIRLQQISSGFIMGQKAKDNDDWSNMDIDMPLWHDIEALDNLDLQPNEVVWLGKSIPKMEALLADVAECDKPLLIITRYSAEAAKIYDKCVAAGYSTGLFTGWKIVGGIDEFKAGNIDILVANSTKIHRGFNLQIAHTTLFYSNLFSMEIRQQTEFRTFRLGQTHPCLYIDYIASEIDDVINNALAMKKNLLDYIRSYN